MKKTPYHYFYLFISLLFPGFLQAQNLAKPVLFNQVWSFHMGDITGAEKENDNAQWKTVDLPHDWSIQQPFSDEWASATGYLPGGIGWYKKHLLPMPPGKVSRCLFISTGFTKTAKFG